MLLPGSPKLLFDFTYRYLVCKCGRVSPNTFHRAARWTLMVCGVSPVVGRLVRTLSCVYVSCFTCFYQCVCVCVCVIARPNVKRRTFSSLRRSLKFEMLHVVHWTFVPY